MLPLPTDYRTGGSEAWSFNMQPLMGLLGVSEALHEWVGLLAYWMMGRTQTLLPSV